MRQLLIVLGSMLLLSACNFVKSDSTKLESAENEKASSTTQANSNVNEADLKGVDLIKFKLESTGQLNIDRIEKSAINNLFIAYLKSGEIVYTDENGSYFFSGDIYHIDQSSKQFVNITEAARSSQRAAIISEIPSKDTITFSPKGKSKGHIYVFTDVDCYYCQKLHQEVSELNEAGLEVRYLAFPRAGLNSATYKKIQSAWCSSEKQEALTKLKNRQSIPNNLCDSDAVAKQYTIGQDIGVRGTPAIITSNGELISGYMPAESLLARLEIN